MTLPGIPDGPAPLAAVLKTSIAAQVGRIKNAIEEGKRRGDLPAALALPACTVTLSGTSPAPNSTDRTVAWDGTEENWTDSNGNPMWSISAPDQIVIRAAGRYSYTPTVTWSNPSGNIAGQRVAYTLRNVSVPASNGVGTIGYDTDEPPAASGKPGGGIALHPGNEMRLNVGDVLRISGWHNQGSDLSYIGTSYGGVMRCTVAYRSP